MEPVVPAKGPRASRGRGLVGLSALRARSADILRGQRPPACHAEARQLPQRHRHRPAWSAPTSSNPASGPRRPSAKPSGRARRRLEEPDPPFLTGAPELVAEATGGQISIESILYRGLPACGPLSPSAGGLRRLPDLRPAGGHVARAVEHDAVGQHLDLRAGRHLFPLHHLVDADRQDDVGDDVDVERGLGRAIDAPRPAERLDELALADLPSAGLGGRVRVLVGLDRRWPVRL